MDVGSASASSANRPGAKKLQQQDSDDPSQYEEEYVLLQIPDFDKTKFCEGVEERFGEHNFRLLSEMRILAKVRVAILDFCRVCRNFGEIWREIGI